MAFGTILKRMASNVGRAAVRNISKPIGQFTRRFGLVGEVLADTVSAVGRSVAGRSERKDRGSTLSGMANYSLGLSIKSLLTSIDTTLKSMYALQMRDENQDLYDQEKFGKKEPQNAIGVLGEKDKGGLGLGGLIGIVGAAVAGLFAYLKKIIPTGLLGILGSAVRMMSSTITRAIVGVFNSRLIQDALKNSASSVSRAGMSMAKVISKLTPALAGLTAGISYKMGADELDEKLKRGEISPEEHKNELSVLRNRSIAEGVGGVVGAGLGMLTGNPLLAVGAGAAVSSVAGNFTERVQRRIQGMSSDGVEPATAIGEFKGDTSLGGVDFARFSAMVAAKESGGDYTAGRDKQSSFIGKYQMGAQALETLGVLKPGAFKAEGNRAIYNPQNWREGYSLDDFYNNKALQEDLFRQLTIQNYQTGKRLGLIKSGENAESVAGKLMAAHLKGWGAKDARSNNQQGVRHFLESGGAIDPVDANGTSVSKYMRLGAESQRMAATIPSNTASMQSQRIEKPTSGAAPVVNVGGDTNINAGGGSTGAPMSFDSALGGVMDPTMMDLSLLSQY